MLKYEEEFIVDRSANTIHYMIYLNGTKVKDAGVVNCGVETDHFANDGRPTKVRKIIQKSSSDSHRKK